MKEYSDLVITISNNPLYKDNAFLDEGMRPRKIPQIEKALLEQQ